MGEGSRLDERRRITCDEVLPFERTHTFLEQKALSTIHLALHNMSIDD